MGQVLLEFDNKLKKSEIVMPLVSSSHEEAGESYIRNQSGIQQTSVYGIKSPLIQINNIMIDFNHVINFELKSISTLPTVQMTVMDNYNLISTLDRPNNDNELLVQILPQFEKAYKKINLTFYISNIKIRGNLISLSGRYKLPELTNTLYKSFGKINTYELFKNIATETKLGFATNLNENNNDFRYVYCNDKSYKSLMDQEISYGGSKTEIYDWWVDFWDNINLVDIYERYNSNDKNKDLQIWISTSLNEIEEDSTVTPIKTTAVLTNFPMYQSSELFVTKYITSNNSGIQQSFGTDKVYSMYDMDNNCTTDYLIEDGDVKKDIFTKYEYIGESYGKYNYMLQKCCRNAFIQKINSESIKVSIRTPLLGLMRGHKVNFMWYNDNGMLDDKISELKKQDLLSENESNLLDNEFDIQTDKNYSDKFILDKSVSGQYLITGCNIKYINNSWEYELTMNRPSYINASTGLKKISK